MLTKITKFGVNHYLWIKKFKYKFNLSRYIVAQDLMSSLLSTSSQAAWSLKS